MEVPLGPNPFRRDDPRYEEWRTVSRYAAEEFARFRADHLNVIPAESAGWKSLADWEITSIAGLFGARAKWMCNFFVSSYEAADRYIQSLQRLVKKTLKLAQNNRGGGPQKEYFLSELKIRLAPCESHWKAEALRLAREAEETKLSKKDNPAKPSDANQGYPKHLHHKTLEPRINRQAEGGPLRAASAILSDGGRFAKEARAMTVAKLLNELNQLKPQMFEDESEYERLRGVYPHFLAFKIAEQRPDLKLKILAIRGTARHIRLAQELAGAHHGRQLSTIQDDWKDFKPAEFKRSG